MSYQIYFINQNKKITVDGGKLSAACELAGFPLNLVCGGNGTCGKCRVLIKGKADENFKEVLACQTEITEDMEIYLEESDYRQETVVLTKAAPLNIELHPSVFKKYMKKDEIIEKMREKNTFFSQTEKVSLSVMQKFSMMNVSLDFTGCTFVYFNDEIIAVEEGDTTPYCYGVAADIGTTTAAVYIYNLNTGELIATKSALNKQTAYGADVITRNSCVRDNPEMLQRLRDCVIDTLNELLEEARSEYQDLKENIYHVVLCGNSTMQHLFYGMNPYFLGVNPFANIIKEEVVVTGRETGLCCNPNAVVEFLPLLGGFVGADTTSVLLTLTKKDKIYLMVDLGTNGELAVGTFPKFLAASTACGPALEGGNIACGMRGTNGAIEKVSFKNNQLTYKVIGEGTPQGLCGSAIIDAVAELRKAGLIDEAGNLLDPDECRRMNPYSPWIRYLHEAEEYNMAFYFTEGEHPVYISQKDIRQIQMAKSSICSGCLALLEEAGLTLESIDYLVLAGAFGNYIDIDNALSIGLLPPVSREKIISIGNGAGQGVQSFLLDQSYRVRAKNIANNCIHVSLAENKKFMESYIKNMNFSVEESL